MEELGLAHGDGRFTKLIERLRRPICTDPLMTGACPVQLADNASDMPGLLDDRLRQRSTIRHQAVRWITGMKLIGGPEP